MILGIIETISPTLLALALTFAIVKILFNVELSWVGLSLFIGIVITLPAIFTMKIVGLVFIMSVPYSMPLIVFQIISALNEEGYKYLAISRFCPVDKKSIYALFVGGGFALAETLYLCVGDPSLGVVRSVTTLPLHMVTAVLLSKAVVKKRYFLLSFLIHITFNIIIH